MTERVREVAFVMVGRAHDAVLPAGEGRLTHPELFREFELGQAEDFTAGPDVASPLA